MKKKIIILLSVVIILLMGIVVWFNTLDVSDSSNYVGVSMACGYIHKR